MWRPSPADSSTPALSARSCTPCPACSGLSSSTCRSWCTSGSRESAESSWLRCDLLQYHRLPDNRSKSGCGKIRQKYSTSTCCSFCCTGFASTSPKSGSVRGVRTEVGRSLHLHIICPVEDLEAGFVAGFCASSSGGRTAASTVKAKGVRSGTSRTQDSQQASLPDGASGVLGGATKGGDAGVQPQVTPGSRPCGVLSQLSLRHSLHLPRPGILAPAGSPWIESLPCWTHVRSHLSLAKLRYASRAFFQPKHSLSATPLIPSAYCFPLFAMLGAGHDTLYQTCDKTMSTTLTTTCKE